VGEETGEREGDSRSVGLPMGSVIFPEGMVTAPRVSVIIVTWNGRVVVRDCLESLRTVPTAVPFEVIVVDNGSTDGSVDEIRAAADRFSASGIPFRMIENRENRGFSGGNNQGLEVARAPYLLLLNSDTEVRAGAIDGLVSLMDSDPGIGACGPRLLNTDGTLQHSVWRNPPTAWEILLEGFKLERLLPLRIRGELLLGSHWTHDRRRRVRRLSGAAMLVRRKVVDEVGGLDERFHMYGEDVEWCLRIARGGWSIVFEPAAVIVHHGSQSALERWGDDLSRVSYEGFLRFQRLCLSRPHLALNLLAQILVLRVQLAWRRARGHADGPIDTGLRMVLTMSGREVRQLFVGSEQGASKSPSGRGMGREPGG